jgi:D-galactose 1-dehydrogenase
MATTKIALIGLGKIARDQHIPALAANADFELIAVASPHNRLSGLPNFTDLPALLKAVPEVCAVAICTTPQVRFDIARHALRHGLHVLLEKPPGMSVSEVVALADLAKQRGVALFASWHSRHACGVEPARAWLSSRLIKRVVVSWKEDVRVWHPGQNWIWEPGGLGVFDPGINALSILTRIIPGALALQNADLSFPENCATPIAARLSLYAADLEGDQRGAPVQVDLDFLQTGPQTWNIEVETDAGILELSLGGKVLTIDGREAPTSGISEYTDLYVHFAKLVKDHRLDVDTAPLQLVADAFLCGRRVAVDRFVE